MGATSQIYLDDEATSIINTLRARDKDFNLSYLVRKALRMEIYTGDDIEQLRKELLEAVQERDQAQNRVNELNEKVQFIITKEKEKVEHEQKIEAEKKEGQAAANKRFVAKLRLLNKDLVDVPEAQIMVLLGRWNLLPKKERALIDLQEWLTQQLKGGKEDEIPVPHTN